jgi:hypothetical protein
VAYNVIANNTLGTQPWAMTLDGQQMGDSTPSIGVHDLAIEKNILFNWGGGLLVKGDAAQMTDIELANDDFQNTSWPIPALEFSVGSSTSGFHSSGNHFFCQLVPAQDWTEIESVPHTIGYWFSQVGDATSSVALVPYADPLRSVETYNASLGGSASLDAFMAEARQQSSTHWRPEIMAVAVNRYIRAGF